MIQPLKIIFSIILCLSYCSVLKAQTPSDSLTSYELESITVEAVRAVLTTERAPLAVSVKKRSAQEIAGSAASSLASITQDLPGIWVNDRQNYSLGERITIRGIGWRAAFGVRGIQVVLDGIPLTVADGQSVTNIIDPALITRIELIRGPAASFWGNSSGGVLYVSTRPDYAKNNTYQLKAAGGSFRYRDLSFQTSRSFGKHDVSSFASYQFDDGYRNYSTSKIFRTGIRGNYNLPSDARLAYNGALFWMPQAQHPSGLTAEQFSETPQRANASFVDAEAGKQVTQGQLGLSYYQPTRAGLLTVSGYGIYRDLNNPLPFGIITVDRKAGGFRTSLEKDFNNLSVRLGGALKYQYDDRQEFENVDGQRGSTTINQIEKVSNQALFAISEYSAGSLQLLASLRYDRITFASDSTGNNQTAARTFQSLSPGLGLSYQLGNATFYSNISTSFEAPTTTELVNRPDGGNGFNPTLKPEQTLGLELGSRGQLIGELLTYDIALYRLWIQDLLFPFQLEENGATFFRNQGETRHQGIEITAELQPKADITLKTSYTLTDAEFVEARTLSNQSLRGNAVPGVAKHRVSTTMSWSPDPFWVQLSGQYVNSYPVNNLNNTQNDRYAVVDAKFSYKRTFSGSSVSITPFINANNVFDNRYSSSVVVNAFGGRYFEPAPGRNLRAGITMQF
jgi:iron complex outermembrane receptor protein